MRTPTGVTIAQYQQAISDGKPTHVRLTFSNQNIVLDDSNITMDGGLTMSTIPNPDSDITMGYCPANVLDVEFINSAVFTGFNWTEEFKFEAGVEINGTTNWVLIGWFKGQKPQKTLRTKTIQFTAYDMMVKFDRLADDWIDSLTFPMTMQAMFRSLCTYVGVGYASSPVNQISAAMNTSYSTNPLFKGISCRTVLAWIAEANGCYAIYRAESGGTGVIDLRFVNSYVNSMTITEDDCFEIDLEDYTIPAIDYVHIASSDEDVPGFVYPLNKTYKYETLDNPLMLLAGTSAKQNMINGIISHFAVMGNYRPMRVVTVGNWLMEVGDMVKLTLADGTNYNLIGINKTIQWNGGCVCEYECPGNIERLEMNQNKKGKYEIGGKLSDKYTIISGVDITDDGVVVSGGKYVKIYSGGIFYVDAPNFKIDSANKYLQSGKWRLSEDGLTVLSTNNANMFSRISFSERTWNTLKTNTIEFIISGSDTGYNPAVQRTYKALLYASTSDPGHGIQFTPETAGEGAIRNWGLIQATEFQGNNIIVLGSGSLRPNSGGTGSVGTSSYYFQNSYIENEYIKFHAYFDKSANIVYQGTKANSNLIRFWDNTADQYGNGIIIGDGGCVIIGAGESAEAVKANSGATAGTETLYLASDGNIKVLTNVNNGYSSRKEFTFGTDGTIVAPGRLYQNGNKVVPLADTWRGFKTQQYQYTYTIPANGDLQIPASSFLGNAAPSGYTPVAMAYFNTSDSNVEVYYLDATATGNGIMVVLHNRANAQISHPMAIKILYLQN